jgi:hypothetical protein
MAHIATLTIQTSLTRALATLAILALAAVPASAQAPNQTGTSPPPAGQATKLHNYTLRNMATKPIESATIHMTTATDADLTTKSRVMPSSAQSFSANNAGCIDSIAVTFAGGATLRADKLNDCKQSTIVVRDNKIDLTDSAAPAAVPPHSH